MRGVSLEEATAAKETLRARLAGLAEIRGIGVAVLPDGYGVKVNLLNAVACAQVPDDVDGVPVIIDVVGAIRAY
jgi:hypothetical protein